MVGSETNNFPVARDGQVTIDVPPLPLTCSSICVGFTIRDGSPNSLKAIHILRDGGGVRRLSLREVEKLPLDGAGGREIRHDGVPWAKAPIANWNQRDFSACRFHRRRRSIPSRACDSVEFPLNFANEREGTGSPGDSAPS